jgi:hypothetical protein
MKSKIEIQKEIDNLQKQIGDLSTRRDVLRADRENILAGKEEKARLVSESLLAGRDASQEKTALESDKVSLTALDDALALAESRLSEFSQKRTDLQRALVNVEFDRLTDEADVLLLAAIAQFQGAVDANKALREKIAELAQIAPAAGQSIDFNDHLKLVRDLNQYFDETSISIVNKLARMEMYHPARLLELRQKKSR